MPFLDNLKYYLRASYPALWIPTFEETRICREIFAGLKSTYKVYQWDCQEGLSQRTDGLPKVIDKTADPAQMFKAIRKIVESSTDENVFLIKDFHLHIDSPLKKAEYIRSLKNIFTLLKAKSSMIVMLSPVLKIPLELSKEVQVLDYALPDERVINERLDFIFNSASQQKKLSLSQEIREAAVEAAKGLTFSEIESAFALGIIINKEFNQGFVETVFKEKVQQVKKGGLMTYLEPDVDFDSVGGLEGIKSWIRVRKNGYTKAARDFELPYPKGFMAAGIPGCGITIDK